MKRILAILIIVVVWCGARQADAAILAPTAPSSTVSTDASVVVQALLQTEGEFVNAAEGTLLYPNDVLEVAEIVIASSPLTLWVESPRVATAGEIRFAGGIPGGAVVANAPLFTVHFRPVRRGTATIAFRGSDTRVLLNDGAGSVAALSRKELVVTVGDPDGQLTAVTSPTHPNENAWYRSRGVVILWESLSSFFYSVRLSNDAAAVPDDVQEDVDGRISYPALTDGVWYFTVQARVPNEPWGAVTHRRVQIDATPPEPFPVSVVEDAGGRIVSYGTTDATSGIDHYDFRITHLRHRWLPFFFEEEWETADGSVSIPRGEAYRSVEVRAIDKAGNERNARYDNPAFLTLQARIVWQTTVTTLVALALIAFSLFALVFHVGRRKVRG